jgi:hypothetical protein
MQSIPHIPELCQDAMLSDGVFADAYESLFAKHRAWLKKLAAETYAMIRPVKRAGDRSETRWSAGFVSAEESRIMARTLLFIDAGVSSPVQVAAAALPPILSGTAEIAAVRVGPGSDSPDSVLAALEMCGVENVYALDHAEARDCLAAALVDPDCACLMLGNADWFGGRLRHSRAFVWARREVRRMAVLIGPDGDFDYDAMAWAHPGAVFAVYGDTDADMPAGFEPLSGGLPAMLETGPEVVFCSRPLSAWSCTEVPLVLGPGQEGCFFWPELTRRTFRRKSLSLWSAGETDTDNGRETT